uniref:Uncharacterized protein n=1 Tax=Oryza brachyantha TaxID=4533 RepID=J3LYP1_ORYBR
MTQYSLMLMVMGKGKSSSQSLHGPNYTQNASEAFPCGRKTIAMMLLSLLLVLVLSAYYPEQIFWYSPMPKHIYHQTAINRMLSNSPFFMQNCHYSYISCVIFVASVEFFESLLPIDIWNIYVSDL